MKIHGEELSFDPPDANRCDVAAAMSVTRSETSPKPNKRRSKGKGIISIIHSAGCVVLPRVSRCLCERWAALAAGLSKRARASSVRVERTLEIVVYKGHWVVDLAGVHLPDSRAEARDG